MRKWVGRWMLPVEVPRGLELCFGCGLVLFSMDMLAQDLRGVSAFTYYRKDSGEWHG